MHACNDQPTTSDCGWMGGGQTSELVCEKKELAPTIRMMSSRKHEHGCPQASGWAGGAGWTYRSSSREDIRSAVAKRKQGDTCNRVAHPKHFGHDVDVWNHARVEYQDEVQKQKTQPKKE